MDDVIAETKHALALISPARLNECPKSVQRLIDELVPRLLDLVEAQANSGLHAAHARLRNEIRGVYERSNS